MRKRKPVPYFPYVLVVDDDRHVRALFRRILEEAGYLVADAATGQEALDLCLDRYFEVVILDLSLPDVDGLELLRSIRKEQPQVRALVVSGFMTEALLPLVKEAGADATLGKPLAAARLLGSVCGLLADRA